MENMPWVIQCLIVILSMFFLPMAVGCCLQNKKRTPLIWWISGQMLLWGLFQLICVPCILIEVDFSYVVAAFGGVSAALAIVGVGRFVCGSRLHASDSGMLTKEEKIGWTIFAGMLFFQLIQAVRLAYGDGDDAYYVAVSAITENAETMYQKLPYTGGGTELDIRHGLAPFPVWIAFLARISGMKAVSVAHVMVPLMLIPMTYGIFGLLGKLLFERKRKVLPFFLIFTEILVLFGDYSFYTAERFMIARSRQGKAALGSIVLPMLLFLMLQLLNHLQEQKKLPKVFWVILCSVMLTGCLCTTMGAFLLCLMVAVTGLCGAVSYRNWKILVPLALCCVPCVCYAMLYVMN